MTDPKPAPEATASSSMGAWILQARKLHNCSLHRLGDRMLLRPPGLHHAGQSCCLIPFLRLRNVLRDGKLSEGVRCSWDGCKGVWSATPEVPDPAISSWDPSLLEEELESKPFLLQLPQSVAHALINAGNRRKYHAGEVVLLHGQFNQDLYLVVKGSLEVLEGEVRIAMIQRGECFGELSLLTFQPVSNTVRCAHECELVAVPRDRFYEMLSSYGSLGSLLNRLLAGRLRASNQQLEQILRPGIWGNLEVFPFLSVVQSIQAGSMTGVLTITRSRGRAIFGFDKGSLRHAQLGSVTGEDTLLEIFRWNTGIFRFQSEPLQLVTNIHGDTMSVLLDGLRRFDEELLHEADSSGEETKAATNSRDSMAETRWDSIDPNVTVQDSTVDSSSDTRFDNLDNPTSEFEIVPPTENLRPFALSDIEPDPKS